MPGAQVTVRPSCQPRPRRCRPLLGPTKGAGRAAEGAALLQWLQGEGQVPCGTQGHRCRGMGGRQAERSRRGPATPVSRTGGDVGLGQQQEPTSTAPVPHRSMEGRQPVQRFGHWEHEGAAALLLPTVSPVPPHSVCHRATPPPQGLSPTHSCSHTSTVKG